MNYIFPHKNYTLLCAILFLLVSNYPCHSQSDHDPDTIFAHLETRLGPGKSSFIQPGKMIDGDGSYIGIPDSLDCYRIFEYVFQPPQYLYEQLLDGNISNEKYLSGIKRFKPSDRKVSEKRTKNRVGVLSALINGKKIIWCDTDNDKDFSDDTPSVYNFKKKGRNGFNRDSIATITVQYEHFYNKKIYDRTKYQLINKFSFFWV